MGMDITGVVAAVCMSADKCLMPRKICFCVFHANSLCLLPGQTMIGNIHGIVADNVMVAFDFIVSLIFMVLLVEQFTLKIECFRIAVQSIKIKLIPEHGIAVFIKDGNEVKFIMLVFLEVPRPNEHLNRRLHEGHDTTFNKWHSSSVLRILDSQVYIGNLVTGKTRTASYKGIGLHPVDKGEWHIVENAHEAIILKSDFEIVQEKRNRNKEKRNNAMARSEQVRAECRNHFAGMVFCGCCRRSMTFVRQVHKTEEESYFGVFQCKRKKGTTPCSYHTVPEKMLMMVAMKQIHHLVSTMCEEEKMVKEMLNNGGLDSTRSIKVKENSIAFRIQETEERRLRLYEDYKAEILDEEEYSRLKEHYIAEKQRLEHELQKQRQRSLELEKRMRICDEQMERMRAILNQKEFDEELVHELIKKIYVGIDNSVEIEFKCSDPYQEVLAFVAEVQNE